MSEPTPITPSVDGHSSVTAARKPRARSEPRAHAQDAQSSAQPRLFGLEAAAAYLGVSPWTVREMEWAGALTRVRLPGVRRLLFDRADLDRLVEQAKGAPKQAALLHDDRVGRAIDAGRRVRAD